MYCVSQYWLERHSVVQVHMLTGQIGYQLITTRTEAGVRTSHIAMVTVGFPKGLRHMSRCKVCHTACVRSIASVSGGIGEGEDSSVVQSHVGVIRTYCYLFGPDRINVYALAAGVGPTGLLQIYENVTTFTRTRAAV